MVAMLSDCKKTKVGVILMYNNKIIADGYNTYKNTIQHKYYLLKLGKQEQDSLYAEEMALDRCANMSVDFNRVCAYICRFDGNDQLVNSRPNEYCIRELQWRGIKNIYYTLANGSVGKV